MKPLHFSSLKWLGKSPAHYHYHLTEPFVPTPAMRLGTLVHQAVLGGPEPIVFEGDRRGKAWTEFKAANDGAEVFTADEAGRAREIAGAVLGTYPVAELLETAQKEAPFSWDIAGRACAGRADAFGPTWVLDLKTTACAEPGKFPWDALRRSYNSQLAWYSNGLRLAGLADPIDHYIVAVETAPPYPVVLYQITPRAIDAGTALWRSWFERLRVCEETNEWPGYTQTIVDLDISDSLDDLDFSGLQEVA